ncbi:MAG: hypothetical protein RML45_11315 [Acetobacteraceae bacterium]|nr:hypothetical protein [Acetobacteraceae bacterium]
MAFDVYPYPASSTVLLPEKLREDVRVVVTWSVPHPEMQGRDLDEIARAWGCTRREAAVRLLPAGAITFQMSEEDVRRILAHPRAMIGSDGLAARLLPASEALGHLPTSARPACP